MSRAKKALARGGIDRQRGPDRLEGHDPPQKNIFSLEHDTHSAGAKNAEHAVRPEPADFVRPVTRRQELILLWSVCERCIVVDRRDDRCHLR